MQAGNSNGKLISIGVVPISCGDCNEYSLSRNRVPWYVSTLNLVSIRRERNDNVLHHCPTVVAQVGRRIRQSILPARKKFVVTAGHHSLLVFVMQIPFVSGFRSIRLREIAETKGVQSGYGRLVKVGDEFQGQLNI